MTRASAVSVSPDGRAPGRIFVVDDDASVCLALARILRLAGFVVETFTSTREFLQRTLPAEGDCVVLDVDMPGMSGPELRDAIRRRGCVSQIIFITGHRPAEIAQDPGGEPVLFKPIDADALVHAIHAGAEAIFSR